MRTIIVGCGRVGAGLAGRLAAAGDEVTIIDQRTDSFDKLPEGFGGNAVRGDGTDEDVLRRLGVEGADRFFALTEGDNRNILAAQLAAETFSVPTVVAKINDPVRAVRIRRPGHRHRLPHGHDGGVPGRLRGPAGRRRRDARAAAHRDTIPASTTRPASHANCRAHRGAVGGPALMYVIVVGGGKVGYYLTKELLAAGHELVLLEKDRSRAKQIADEVGSIVLARDGCEGQHLAEAGANRAAIVAAVTGDDEDNLVVCQMAKHHFDVPRTIARVNNPRNEELFRHLGVDEIISPTRMALAAIEQDIPVHELLHLAQLEGGELELLEAQIGDESPAIGRKPGDIVAARWLFAVRAHPGRAGAAHPPGDHLPGGRQGAGHHADRMRARPASPAHRDAHSGGLSSRGCRADRSSSGHFARCRSSGHEHRSSGGTCVRGTGCPSNKTLDNDVVKEVAFWTSTRGRLESPRFAYPFPSAAAPRTGAAVQHLQRRLPDDGSTTVHVR